MPEERPELETLLAVYKSAIEEYRFNVNLGWERQKLFLALNPTVLGLVAAVQSRAGTSATWLTRGALIAAALATLLGIHVVGMSHRYYQNSKSVVLATEEQLGLPHEMRLRTTLGMGAAQAISPAMMRLKVVTAVKWVLGIFCLLDLVLFVLSCLEA